MKIIRLAMRFAARAAWNKYRSAPWAWAADVAIVSVLVAAIWGLR